MIQHCLLRDAPFYRVSVVSSEGDLITSLHSRAADDESAIVASVEAAHPNVTVHVRDGLRVIADIKADQDGRVFVEHFYHAGGIAVCDYYEALERFLMPLDHVPVVFQEEQCNTK